MEKAYLDFIKDNIVLFDGAIGTVLFERGVFINRCFEEISFSNPEMVKDIHQEYLDAGAQVLTTNTFGANPIKLGGYNLGSDTDKLIRASVGIARQVAGDLAYVAGSVGPLGQIIAPVGKLERSKAEAAFTTQIKALIESGVDLVLLETFHDLEELKLAAGIVKKIAPDMPVQAQMTVGAFQDEGYNEKALQLALKLEAESAVDVLGFNCTVGPSYLLDILTYIRPHITKPISVIPNAGFPKEVEGRQIYLTSPDYFAEYAIKFLEAGANVIGGCCGTTAEHIHKMGKAVLSLDRGFRGVKVAAVETVNADFLPEIPLAERSAMGKALANGEWITSIELVPPLGCSLAKTIEKASKLKDSGITCINIPDGPRASSRISAMATAIGIQQATGIDCMPHVCSRDRNLIGLQSDLLGAEAMGLNDILFVTGDPPKVGNYPDVTGVFDVDSIGMIHMAKRLNQGIDIGGNSIKTTTSFVIGAGANPVHTYPEKELERTFAKAEAGAEYFITQPVFDVELLIQFIDNIKETNVPLIAGVWPLASYRNALFLNNEVPGVEIPEEIMKRMEKHETKEGAREEGILIAREIIDQVRDRIAGVQVSPPFGRVETALSVIKES